MSTLWVSEHAVKERWPALRSFRIKTAEDVWHEDSIRPGAKFVRLHAEVDTIVYLARELALRLPADATEWLEMDRDVGVLVIGVRAEPEE